MRLLAIPAAFALLLAAPATAASAGVPAAAPSGAESVHVKLLELNKSGATGTATLTALGNGDLRISIRATGMVPDSPHAQHLHGSTDGMDFHCPTMAADTDGDGFLSTEEGMPDYGDIFVSLTTAGDTSKASGLAVDRMPVAGKDGKLSYDRTIKGDDLPPGTVKHLKDLHVVQHGIDTNDNGKYDLDALGESTLAKAAGLAGIPQEATNPASCGMVAGAAVGSVPVGGVATGDGSSTIQTNTRWYAYGGLAALLAVVAVVVARRRAYLLPR
jgi:hypothetical protein